MSSPLPPEANLEPLTLSDLLRHAADTRFQLALYDAAGRHTVKQVVLEAASRLEKMEHALRLVAGYDFKECFNSCDHVPNCHGRCLIQAAIEEALKGIPPCLKR